ncbi:hypothetical protein QQX98_004039 [Neonectria punicea]|uniref:Adenine DNA glycosylase n=1 Tax=Neonectria punicea TaxID=979145 RepID=A0ABR1HAT7_9HYPO
MSSSSPAHYSVYQSILHKKQGEIDKDGGGDDKSDSNSPFNQSFEDVKQIMQDGYTLTVIKTQMTFKQENDRRGRFSEYSLLLRRIMDVKSNARPKLQLEIQSHTLREAFAQLADDLTTIRLSHDPIVIPEPFMEVYHCREKIQKAVEVAENGRLRAELQLLLNFQDKYMVETTKTIDQFIDNCYIAFEWLWAIFPPGELVVIENNSASATPIQWCARVKSFEFQALDSGVRVWNITVTHTGFNGLRLGKTETCLTFPEFSNNIPISRLPAYPVKYCKDESGLQLEAARRGRNYVAYCLASSKSKKKPIGTPMWHAGPIWTERDPGRDDRRGCRIMDSPSGTVRGRAIVDFEGFFGQSPTFRERLDSGNRQVDDDSSDDSEFRMSYRRERLAFRRTYTDASISQLGTPLDADSLLEDDILTCPPLVPIYTFASRQWCLAFIDDLSEIEWNQHIFEQLQIDEKMKEAIQGLVLGYSTHATFFDDFVEGKGQGLVFLLHGPPGCGKTMSAESISESLQKPLYHISGGELGASVESIQDALETAFDRAARWDTILLLDEADAFLARRDGADIERNSLIADTTTQGVTSTKRRPARRRDASESDATAPDESDEPAPKRRKAQPSRAKSKTIANQLHQRLFGPAGRTGRRLCAPPTRRHDVSYHRPALLDDAACRLALLSWFDSVSTKRKMPWRKAWINPREHDDASELRRLLERRAYEVWISEIMLQQTRVIVVIDYWTNWMAKWQTIHDLAAAEPDDVLSAWRGLGYYSRAARIHQAAKLVVQDPGMKGLLPSQVEDLEAKVPGVGRYTAGAISAIVFGRAVPMVDGNVLRVLSRQLGLLGNVKTDKGIIDTLWAAAAALAQAVAQDGAEDEDPETRHVSNRPGRWGQALMELGSTVCTPKPNCGECPISSTCHAYGEGKMLASGKKVDVEDIEDFCDLCDVLEETTGLEGDADAGNKAKAAPKQTKQMKLSAFAFKDPASVKTSAKPKTGPSPREMEVIVDHARKFPLKVVKKAARIEETLVCVIRRSDGHHLIQKRPDKGLLAGLWEFPSEILQESDDNSTSKLRKSRATAFVTNVISQDKTATAGRLKHVGELGSVPWLFSHIKLTMHVHLFTVDTLDDYGVDAAAGADARLKWVSNGEADRESMGTGMRKCWALAKAYEE